MTIVELYDEKPINNIVGALAFHPDKIVYVGGYSKNQFDSKKLPVLKKYLAEKKINTLEIEYVQIRRDSLKDIIDKLESVYSTNKNCKFHVEVTGGEDLVLIGLGVLCQRYPEIELYQISSKLRSIRSFSVASDDEAKLDIKCSNTVKENILLHGASIVSFNGNDILNSEYQWSLDFYHDIETMWGICCNGIDRHLTPSAPYSWNKVTTMLSALDSENDTREDNITIVVDSAYFKKSYMNGTDGSLFYDYICYFIRTGLLDCKIESDYTYIKFKNAQVRMCLTKSGLILELKIYLLCCQLVSDRSGDCLTGVTIDWDGDDDLISSVKYLYDTDNPDSTIDTTNEIDVLANCGLTPYFISCKNGKFNSSELYKLYSVGERFSSGYGKKILVTTNSPYALGEARNVLLQRAADMGICVIENVHKKSDNEISEELKKAMELPKIKKYA
ncbi:MAG: hypothetical protein NC548_31925 [Lachnospiraceae bacterium]|nr:hypothetical protein [Lachnospiraceae bacterium]MCM1230488.1 hypothetical protein [Ruminococcus flavefaciens]